MKKVLFVLMLLVLSCDLSDDNSNEVICTTEFVYGLNVSIKDAVTNSVIIDVITVIASDGAYEETLMTIDNNESFFGAGERPGNYIILVTSNNYETFVSDEIVVDANECHVIPESLEILLQPN